MTTRSLPQRSALGLLLLAAVVVAGCTTPFTTPSDNPASNQSDGENDTDPNDGTLVSSVIQRLSLDDDTLYEGGATNLVVRVANPGDQAMEDVRVTIGNYGDLQLTRRVPEQRQSNLEPHQCSYAAVSPRSDGRRCVWNVQAERGLVDGLREQVTLPLTAFATYTRETAADGSLEVTFAPREQIQPGSQQQQTIRIGNSEVQVSVQHASPVSADGEVPITVTVENVGAGDIMDTETGPVLTFEGTLADEPWLQSQTSCTDSNRRRVITFDGTPQSVTFDCTIAIPDSDLADKTFFLRPRFTYRYRTHAATQLTVLED